MRGVKARIDCEQTLQAGNSNPALTSSTSASATSETTSALPAN